MLEINHLVWQKNNQVNTRYEQTSLLSLWNQHPILFMYKELNMNHS